MKFKKMFFLWLFLALAFFSVKTNAKILKIQSRYLGFVRGNSQIYAEFYIPCSKELEKFFRNSIKNNDKLDRDPDVAIIVDDINSYGSQLNDAVEKEINKDNKKLLEVYDNMLNKKKYILMISKKYNNQDIRFEFMANVDKVVKMANDIHFSLISTVNSIAESDYKALKKILSCKSDDCKVYNIAWEII